MRRFAFVIAITGLFFLLVMINIGAKEIFSYEELYELEVNTKVVVSGRVVDERVIFEGTKIFVLRGGIELICDCLVNLEGEDVNVEGIVEEYEGKKQVRVLRITA